MLECSLSVTWKKKPDWFNWNNHILLWLSQAGKSKLCIKINCIVEDIIEEDVIVKNVFVEAVTV